MIGSRKLASAALAVAGCLGLGGVMMVAAPAEAAVYCGPRGCVGRPGVYAPAARAAVARPGVGYGAPGVGYGARGVGLRPGRVGNRGGPVNRVGPR